MPKHMVTCRICKEKFDAQPQDENILWVKPKTNYYYHKACHENLYKSKPEITAKQTDSAWYDCLLTYLECDIKAPMDYSKIRRQWNTFLKQGKTAKGIYFAVVYHYEECHGNKNKSEKGIGIVSKNYEDSKDYWCDREIRERGILQKLEEQIKARTEQRVVLKVKNKKKEKTKPRWELEDEND